ncbi:MAG: helicase associated domain-containing protein [Cyclobacteriaceae bacterium]
MNKNLTLFLLFSLLYQQVTAQILAVDGLKGRTTGDESGPGYISIWGISDQFPATDWGFVWDGDPNQFKFIGNSVERLTIDMDDGQFTTMGNIGIGTTSPDRKLEIYDAVPVISLRNSADGTDAYGWLEFNDVNSRMGYVGFGSSGNNNLYLRNEIGGDVIMLDGNIGIGTDSPTASMEINKPEAGLKIFSNLSSQPYLTLGVNQTDRWSLGVYETTNNVDGRTFFIYENHTGVSGTSGVRFAIVPNGNVGIGTKDPLSKLSVNGHIRATEVKVLADITVPDYVFEPNYDLRTLEETKAYIAENKHLPEIPSAAEIEENGIDLGDMNMRLLKKIEELTLHQIELMEEMQEMKKELKALKE